MKGIKLVAFIPYGDGIGNSLEEAITSFKEAVEGENVELLEEIVEIER